MERAGYSLLKLPARSLHAFTLTLKMKFISIKNFNETGEMAHWLTVLAALPKDPSLIPSTHRVA